MQIIEKYLKLVDILSENLVGKEEVIKSAIITLLAKENIILVGPPGTAKSEVARRLTKIIKGGKYFEYLLTKFTTPEELFGPVSLTDLKEDKFKRQTNGYLPSANIGFLDEIFKANSSILNSLLTIINEKVYHNGNIPEKTNIVTIVGASNELPTNEAELAALYDRFIMRKIVGYVSNHDIAKFFTLKRSELVVPEEYMFTIDEINDLNEKAKDIRISLKMQIRLKKLREDISKNFEDEGISDRKFLKLLHLLRISAYLNGKNEVTHNDLVIIGDCLWNKPENREQILKIAGIDNVKKVLENK